MAASSDMMESVNRQLTEFRFYLGFHFEKNHQKQPKIEGGKMMKTLFVAVQSISRVGFRLTDITSSEASHRFYCNET